MSKIDRVLYTVCRSIKVETEWAAGYGPAGTYLSSQSQDWLKIDPSPQ